MTLTNSELRELAERFVSAAVYRDIAERIKTLTSQLKDK